MAITVNGQILRNLPEQVSKNTEDILELQDVSENYGIRITALEGNAIALATFQDCTFTGTSSFQGPISSNSGFTFDGSGSLGGNLSVGGNLAITGSSTFTGTVTASGNENVGGNLAVTGNITGGSIVENMSGYSAELKTVADLTIENVYTGAVKTGNKLTIVSALNVTKTNSLSGTKSIVDITVPAEVANEIRTTQIGLYGCLIYDKVNGVDIDGTFYSLNYYFGKNFNTININLQAATIDSLPLNKKTYIRFEATFLLSSGLI